jgi:hypothetical protein
MDREASGKALNRGVRAKARDVQRRIEEVRRLEDKFFGLELNHVACRYNKVADELAKIASGRTTVPLNIFVRDIYQPSMIPSVTPGFRRQTECEPCTCQDQLFTYTAVT